MSTESDVKAGVSAVFQTAAVTAATAIFLPGVLLRVALVQLAVRSCGAHCELRDFSLELGGAIRDVRGSIRWPRVLAISMGGSILIGAVLLLPAAVRFNLLDIRPFASLSGDPRSLFGSSFSLLSFLDVPERFGAASALRIWIGVACLYCSIPSSEVLSGASTELQMRRFVPVRLLLTPVVWLCRFLRAVDGLLSVGGANAFIASGLLVSLLVWRLLSVGARLMS